MTGKCYDAHKRPNRILGANASSCKRMLGNAKPIQPISSKNQEGTPNHMPTRKRLGAYTGETNVSNKKRTARTRMGGMRSAAYQRAGNRHRHMREKRSHIPSSP